MLSMKPLEDYLKRRIASWGATNDDGNPLGLASLVSSASRQSIERAKRVGVISSANADRIALELGVTPSDIWGSEWWSTADDEPRCSWCGVEMPWTNTAARCAQNKWRVCESRRDAQLQRDAFELGDTYYYRLTHMTDAERDHFLFGAPEQMTLEAAA